jgi:RNA polymerase sigma factor (sigma-70 family)
MPKYRLDIIHTLARQISFAPVDVRRAQLHAAEILVGDLDAAKSYPPDFITFRVTGYKPKGKVQRETLTGLALEHDLCALIEDVSVTMSLRAADEPEPVLSIDDATARFNVTSKTIQRWRKKGLVSRRFIFADGKSRVGFLLSSIERFIARNSAVVRDNSNLATMTLSERDTIVRHARRLAAADWNLCDRDLTLRLARRYRRSSLTILHTLRKHDAERPDSAVLCALAGDLEPRLRSKILKSWRRGRSLSRIARRAGVTRAAAYRAIIDERINRLSGRRAKFHDDELYHGDDAEAAIESIVRSGDIDAAATREELRVPTNLPPYLADLYRTPLLSPKQERALFLLLNYRKFRFTMARRAFDPELVCSRDLKTLELYAAHADAVKNRIVAANLRLVVSVARKHAAASERTGGPTLMELVSEGNLILMRAVDGFDLHRNVRFSTYATLALMKGFARLVPELRTRARRATSTDVAALELADRREAPATDRLAVRDEVARLLCLLTPAERIAIAAQFGLDGEKSASKATLGDRRTRQIERDAIEKLRKAVVGSTRR